MHIEVISSVNEARADRFTHRTAIVIDVLRATSTVVAAVGAGAAGIFPVETVLEARALQREGDLLAGERFGRKIPGFDLGNSPDDFNADTVRGRRIVLTTTNGTRAIHKAMRADYVLAGALTNATACAAAAAELRRDIVLLCAGCHDSFALEDGLCAGLLIDRLEKACGGAVEMDDFSVAMVGLYRGAADRIGTMIAGGTTGKRLIKLGFARDVSRCAALDCCDVVPRLSGDMIV